MDARVAARLASDTASSDIVGLRPKPVLLARRGIVARRLSRCLATLSQAQVQPRPRHGFGPMAWRCLRYQRLPTWLCALCRALSQPLSVHGCSSQRYQKSMLKADLSADLFADLFAGLCRCPKSLSSLVQQQPRPHLRWRQRTVSLEARLTQGLGTVDSAWR